MKNLAYRIFIYISGLSILSLGVVCMIKSNVGVAPWDALNVVLAEQVGLTVGIWVFIVGGVLIFLNSFIKVEGKRPNLKGFLPILLIGLLVDLLNLRILAFLEIDSFPFRWFLFSVGLCILGLGIALYLRSSFPAIPNDEFMLALTERTGWSIQITKTLGEAFAFIIASLLQGPIGIGTLIVLVFIGWFIKMFDKMFDRIGIPRL